jgi:hypothetical protein
MECSGIGSEQIQLLSDRVNTLAVQCLSVKCMRSGDDTKLTWRWRRDILSLTLHSLQYDS